MAFPFGCDRLSASFEAFKAAFNPGNRRRMTRTAAAKRIVVSGGGPVGLTLACQLKLLLGDGIDVTDYDDRWIQTGAQVRWRGAAERVIRREQVVTLQSAVYSQLPDEVSAAFFARGASWIWPQGPSSPATLGKPMNVRIRDVEDGLLELAVRTNVKLRAERFAFDSSASNYDLLVIAEGSQSTTREVLIDVFGQADPARFSVNGNQLFDTVLGMNVTARIPPALAVVLTISQNRYLLNYRDGSGFLNMRLTEEEAREVVGIRAGGRAFFECVQSNPCPMVRDKRTKQFVCPTHGTIFKPSIDPNSFLYPRMLQGLALFGMTDDDLQSVTAFQLSMVQRPRFTAEIRPGIYAALIGDAANAIHFWPGRGINQGLLSAVALARVVVANGQNGRGFIDGDFTEHEGVMAMLQHRYKSWAWRAMVVEVGGLSKPIRDVIADAFAGVVPRDTAIAELVNRCERIAERLAGRLECLPMQAEFRDRFSVLDDETLNVLVASGGWETRATAGSDPDVAMFLPDPVIPWRNRRP